jgi:hypothetical protein
MEVQYPKPIEEPMTARLIQIHSSCSFMVIQLIPDDG